jgi:hypothetical protein
LPPEPRAQPLGFERLLGGVVLAAALGQADVRLWFRQEVAADDGAFAVTIRPPRKS